MDPDQPVLRRLGRFELIRPLGQGGMGQVFLARDTAMGREVALKTISSDMLLTPKAKERFLQEAKAAGALSHPGLVTVHELGEDAGTLFLVMEYLPGEDLSALLRRRALQPAQALELLAQVCDGLAYAHAKGVLHRDVKPSNIRVLEQSGRTVAKLMDFGVARLPDSQLTGTGDRVGTLSYMAPEYLRGGAPTIQCDLYPVGMMLHEALTGHLPSLAPTLSRAGGARPAPLSGTVQEIPPRLAPLLQRALAADPADRFPSAEAFAAALRAAAQGGASTRLDLPPVTGPEPSSFRGLGWIAAALVLGAGGWLAWRYNRHAVPAPVATAPESPATSEPASTPPASLAQMTSQAAQPGAGAPASNATPALSSPAEPPAVSQAAPPPTTPGPAPAQAPSQDDEAFARDQAQAFATAYDRGDWAALGAVLDRLQRRRIDGRVFGRNEEIRQVMEADRQARKIPYELVQRLRAYLPPPPGAQGQGPDQRPGGPPPRDRN